jgi:hypothetical protein
MDSAEAPGSDLKINKKKYPMLKKMHHHHQPINVPTAGAQAFLMDYPQGERAITHHAGLVRIGW